MLGSWFEFTLMLTQMTVTECKRPTGKRSWEYPGEELGWTQRGKRSIKDKWSITEPAQATGSFILRGNFSMHTLDLYLAK